ETERSQWGWKSSLLGGFEIESPRSCDQCPVFAISPPTSLFPLPAVFFTAKGGHNILNAVFLLLGVLSTDADSVLKRGKTVPAAPTTTIDAMLADPASFPDSQVVVIDGMVVRSCTVMGCWMQL